MKNRLVAALVFLLLLSGIAASGATGSNAAWERLKSLVGEWEGKYSAGTDVQVSYKLVSKGTALMETLRSGNEPEMVTLYHPDGDRLVMTHYCSMDNQPRMRAEPVPGEVKKITFRFLDATNLASPEAPHMRQLVLTFSDQDHLTQEWTMREKGKDGAGVFQLVRKK